MREVRLTAAEARQTGNATVRSIRPSSLRERALGEEASCSRVMPSRQKNCRSSKKRLPQAVLTEMPATAPAEATGSTNRWASSREAAAWPYTVP